jgi:uncharacterized protein
MEHGRDEKADSSPLKTRMILTHMRRFLVPLLLASSLAGAEWAPITPVAYKALPAMPDVLQPLDPSAVRLEGWLGARIDANVRGRLDVVDTVPLLAGYIKKPGESPYIGEHIGKWLHAATLAWAYTGDDALRHKLDDVASQLVAAQEPDGYLGTYLPAQRFGIYPDADWDVWSHKYCIIGLLTYYRYTGNPPALACARRAGDVLIATFPAKKSILAAGTHVGMAATSVLEPIVELYRVTGEERYLAFARYIVGAYDEPGGPSIVKALLTAKPVSETANGKAYEMLSNLVGLCELARATGDGRLLSAVTLAWTDIVRNRLYLTGTSSNYEKFGADHELPNGEDAHVGETCVTTTWIQLNLQLLRLTGDAAYADEIERSLYNHLTAAQNPRGDDWCYFTALEGLKHYDKGITCCHSSGPRALALAPTAAYLRASDTLYVSTFEPSSARFQVGGDQVDIVQQSGFPTEGRSTLVVRTAKPVGFALKIRVPPWAVPLRAGDVVSNGGWASFPARTWHDGDRVDLSFALRGRVIRGEYTNFDRAALAWGPFVLAVDSARNPMLESIPALRLAPGAEPVLMASTGGLLFRSRVRGPWVNAPVDVTLVPFADAGASGGEYRIWLRAGI